MSDQPGDDADSARAARPADRSLAEGCRERICEGGERFVIVGAGGWLGSAALELLSESLGPAFEERVVAIGSSERLLQLRGGRTAPQLAIENLASLPERPTVVLHMAFLTKDRASTMARDEYVAANRRISSIVQQSLDPIGARAIFLPSSLLLYAVSTWWARNPDSPMREAVDRGLAPVATGLFFAGPVVILQSAHAGWFEMATTASVCAILFVTRAGPYAIAMSIVAIYSLCYAAFGAAIF